MPRVPLRPLLLTAVLALAPARALGAQAWNAPAVDAVVARAVARRSARDTTLRAYTAEARGTLRFLADVGEGLLGGARTVKAEEIATTLQWRAPGRTVQRIVGRRDTMLLPGDVGFYRDRYGVVTDNLGDRIRLGDARDVRDLPHPLSPEGRRTHEFALVDSLALAVPGTRVEVYELVVRPRPATAAGVAGTIYVDRASGDVVRMALAFTPAAIVDRRIERLTLTLENVLVERRYWLPYRQELEVVRGTTWLDFPVKGIVRGRWEVCCHEVVADSAPLPPPLAGGIPMLDRDGDRIVLAPPAERAAFAWDEPITASLARDETLATSADAETVARRAEALVAARLAGGGGAAVRGRALSDFARVNRVEGLALGAGAALRPGGGWTLRLDAGYGFADDALKGRVELARAWPRGLEAALHAERRYRDAGDVAEASGVRNSLAALVAGEDHTDLYEVRGVGARLGAALGGGASLALTVARERHEPLAVNASPWSGTFRDALPAEPLDAVRASLAFAQRPTPALGGTLAVRAEARALRRERGGPLADATTWRLAADLSLDRPLGDGHALHLRLQAGGVTGAEEPAQELVRFGGMTTAPGYRYHAFATTAGAAVRVEPQLRIPFVALPTVVYAQSAPSRATLAPYAQVACVATGTDARPDGITAAGCYPSAGLGLQLLFDLVRLDVARGLREGGWRVGVDVAAGFWGVL